MTQIFKFRAPPRGERVIMPNFPMADIVRLEIGPPSEVYEICVSHDAGLDSMEGEIEYLCPCRIHPRRDHYGVTR